MIRHRALRHVEPVDATSFTRRLNPNGAIGGFVAPDAVLAESVTVDESSRVGARAVLKPGVCIGGMSHVGAATQIGVLTLVGFDVQIGDNVAIGDSVIIGPHCHIGTNTTIGSGAHIGAGAFIGEGVVIDHKAGVSCDATVLAGEHIS